MVVLLSRILLLVCLLFISNAVSAQRAEPIHLLRLTGPIQFDGMSDEPAWESIAPFPLVQYEPVFGAPPSEHTEIRVAYDDDYIYASIRAYETDPSGIRVNSLYRDRTSGDDLFVILLDTFNDNENAVTFTTNPAGLRRDAAVSNDGVGTRSLNADFNTFWDVIGVTTDEGWFVEMRIPFSSLRFQDDDGRVTMGMIVQRVISRKNERATFPPLAPNLSRAFLKPSLAQKVVLEGVYAQKPLYLTPYGMSGIARSFSPNDSGAALLRTGSTEREIGLDMKYGLTNSLTMDLTINTDFAQVEADDQQVNLTRFSLFFPEKRQFFQERSGIFEFRTGPGTRLFHSRQIGLTSGGTPVRILGGARAIGRVGSWDIGFLDMQTAQSGVLPSENFGVLRLRRQVLNPFSYAGAMATSRIGVDGSYNIAYGLDGSFRIHGEDYISAYYAHTFDHVRLQRPDARPLDGVQITSELERRVREGFGYRSIATWSGRDYLPGVGFSRRNDFTQLEQRLSYGWMPGEASALLLHSAEFSGQLFLRNASGEVESFEIGPEWGFNSKLGTEGGLQLRMIHENLSRPFNLSSDAYVPAGQYTFYEIETGFDLPRSYLMRIGAELNAGSFYDGWRSSVAVSPTWNVSRHLELSSDYLFTTVQFDERDQHFESHIVRVRISTALNTRVSTNSFIQYNSAAEALQANIRFRYNFREGNDLWIVYNEGLDTGRYRSPEDLSLTESRKFLVKYTHTFHL